MFHQLQHKRNIEATGADSNCITYIGFARCFMLAFFQKGKNYTKSSFYRLIKSPTMVLTILGVILIRFHICVYVFPLQNKLCKS